MDAIRRFRSAAWAAPGRWPRLLFAASCLLVLGMYCTNRDMGGDPDSPRGDGKYRPVLARGDGHLMYLMARSTALDGDWVFDNDLARFGDPWNEPRTATGRKSIVHPIGPALVWTPLIWTAEAGAAVADALGADIPLHGYTLWHQRFVFLSSVLFGCGAVLLARRLARRTLGGAWAPTYGAVAVLLGTSLTYYSTYMPSYSHAMDAFACSAFLAYWALTHGRADLKRWLVLGVLLGLAALVRVQEVALGIVVAFEIAARVIDALRGPGEWLPAAKRWIGGGVLALAVACVVFTPQLIEWHVVFGKVGELPQGPRFTRLGAPMLAEVLFSARNGWFSSTPIAYAGCIGLLLFPRRVRAIGIGLFLAVALQVYLNSTVLDWWSGASFGQRRMCNVTLPIALGVACLIYQSGRLAARWPRPVRHGVLVAILGVFVGWNLVQVFGLTRGKPANDALTPTCCGRIAPPLRGIAQWFYDRIGNPFELPASALFAIEHRVPLSRWDQTVGAYPLQPGLADLHDDARFYAVRGSWNLGGGGIEPYLVSGWSAPGKRDGRACRLTLDPVATVLVPNLMPDRQRMTLWLASAGSASVVIEWNGERVAAAQLTAAWTPVVFEPDVVGLHTNELTIRSGWPVPGQPVGVAVGELDIELVKP